MTELQATALILVAVTGTIVVAIPEPDRQTLAAGLFGLCLALLFFVFRAPDVALSQLVIGGVALPAMVLLALGKIHRQRLAAARRDEADGDAGGDR